MSNYIFLIIQAENSPSLRMIRRLAEIGRPRVKAHNSIGRRKQEG